MTGPTSPSACSSCGSGELTRLPMVLTDGTPVVFLSCHRCERKEWVTDDGDGGWRALPIDDVVQRSTKHKPEPGTGRARP